ncbi:MAG: phosphoenolpyruvate--protein phosphotransferase [Desulfuromonadales bacterium C00003107]|nr:MAG: phosphoenolpyruvate--protein phosphotransferase [Desulfuromonadales bacterium C00003107]
MTKLSRKKLGVTTLEDISTLILQSHDLDETLNNIVALVARRTEADVCSIYLLDEDETTLRLSATRGLSLESVGQVTMSQGEGLTGLVVEEGRVVAAEEARDHPRYHYFQETGEEQFHSFLGIPLLDRKKTIGVLVIQTLDPRTFNIEETSALSTIAFQVASIVINARLLDFIHQKEQEAQTFALALEKSRQALPPIAEPSPQSQEGPLRGTVAYPGLASGPAHVMVNSGGFADFLEEDQVDPEEERQRIEQALEKTRIQTIFLEKRVAERLSPDDASIFHTHLMILEDRAFLQRIQQLIEQRHCATYALKKVVDHYINAFERMDDPYLRERAADMKDIGRRLAVNLSGREDQVLHLKHPGILIAKEILPSDMASLDHEQILGIVTESGEKNSHAVIMAKSLGIPALVGVKSVVEQITPEETVILDANSGCLYASPPTAIIEEYSRLEEEARLESHRLEEFAQLPAITKDGTSVVLRANIGLVSDMAIAQRNGAEGVGLYRTEFPYMIRADFPDREEQYRLYARFVEGFHGQPVTIRTLDIGGDKALPYFSPPPEENPFMGWRSVRVSLDNRDIFRTQIEAILMAAVHGPVKLLFPMISGLEEIRACKEVIAEARQNLSTEGLRFAEQIPVGVMIEVPAAVTMAGQLAKEVDFFALGTNDLIQYMLAADRNNPLVNKYYDPLHPAVLQVLHQVAEVARKQNKGLCLCGEMASDPAHFLLLLGMGIREFSMAAPFIPRIKAQLRDLSLSTAQQAAKKALTMDDSAQIGHYLQQVLNSGLAGS